MDICLKTLGCRLNEAESEQWATAFQAQGHTLARQPEHADLVVVNTCAVTREAVKKSRQLIRRSHRNNPTAKLVVSGCYASLMPDIQNKIAGIDLLIDNRDKDSLVDIVQRELSIGSMPEQATEPGATALFARGRDRAFIKIQDGCRYRCTFCIVTVARGEERSRPAAEIIDEINRHHTQGIREVVLTGVHAGGYGSDNGSSLHRLVNDILGETDIPRLRLGSVEPWDLGDEFFRLFENKRLMPHLHLPLQSGSDSVLRRMARRCRTADFENLVTMAKERIPDFNVTTDIIAGFPGETDAEWRTGFDFIKQIGFSHIHIFPYSPRTGTKAAESEQQVPADIKKERCQQLHALAIEMKQRFMRGFIGTSMPVLFESNPVASQDNMVFYGYTPNYLRVELSVPADVSIANRICDVRLTGLNEQDNTLVAAFAYCI